MMYVNGDSWSWHKDLHTADIWPNLLAQQIGLDCINESIGCGSNSRILDNITNLYISGIRPNLIVLALNIHHRYHLPAANMGAWSISPQTIRNDQYDTADDSIKDWYYIHGHNDVDSIYRYYRTIWLLHAVCEKFKCPFFIFQMWDPSIQKLGLLNSTKNIKDFLANSKIDLNTQQGLKYLKSFSFFANQRNDWNYLEGPVSSYLSKTDFAEDGHPNLSGHKEITKFVLNQLTIRNLLPGSSNE
jgi:hypothetical protein